MSWVGVVGGVVLLYAVVYAAGRSRTVSLLKGAAEWSGIVAWPGTVRVTVVEEDIAIPGLPESANGLRLLHLSDIHRHEKNAALVEEAVKRINELQPDLVLLTGDFVQYEPDPIIPLARQLKRINCTGRVYASLGNHDTAKRGAKLVIARELGKQGISTLENASVAIGEGVSLVGMGDLWDGEFRPERAFQEVPPENVRIVMSHNPDTAEELAKYRADLILSGHTHGGSVRLPLIGSLYPWYKSFAMMLPPHIRRHMPHAHHLHVVQHTEWVEGTFAIPRTAQSGRNVLHVTRGLGSHPNGFRVFCDPEMSLLTLRRA